MSEEFKVEIVNPEKSFLVKEDVSEVVVPALKERWEYLKIIFLSFHF
jgi:F-type H+-transporting ATPase subunit epsilon/F-type H+-transporting ATPase subunit delta